MSRNNTVIFKLLEIKNDINTSPNRLNQSVPELCERFQIGRRLLSNSFKEKFGYSISEFLKERSLAKGLELISTETKIRIYDIATILGYSDKSSFTKAFKRRFGMCPREYKKQFQCLEKISVMK